MIQLLACMFKKILSRTKNIRIKPVIDFGKYLTKKIILTIKILLVAFFLIEVCGFFFLKNNSYYWENRFQFISNNSFRITLLNTDPPTKFWTYVPNREIETSVAYVLHKNRIINIDDKKDSLLGIERLNVSRSTIPAVTHVDYSARIQTVTKETNSIFYDLIRKLKDVNDCPVVINTSFNVRGEPIVCTPEDAFNCFMGTNIDILVIGNYFLSKTNQRPELKKDYKGKYELD